MGKKVNNKLKRKRGKKFRFYEGDDSDPKHSKSNQKPYENPFEARSMTKKI
jgi:hypothetical protein